jgi:hypothetical protein
MRHCTAAVAAALFFCTLTACTTGGDRPRPTASPASGPSTKPGPVVPSDDSEAALAREVRSYGEAYFTADTATAYSHLSARCREKLPPQAYENLLLDAASEYGRQDVRLVKVDLISGDTALVSYSYDLPELDETRQKWVRERGQWRYDAC